MRWPDFWISISHNGLLFRVCVKKSRLTLEWEEPTLQELSFAVYKIREEKQYHAGSSRTTLQLRVGGNSLKAIQARSVQENLLPGLVVMNFPLHPESFQPE